MALAGAPLLVQEAAANVAPPPAGAAVSDFYEDGAARFARGDFQGAIVQLKNVLQEQPGNLAARVLIGRAYVETGDGATAEKELQIALRDGADETLVVVPLGQALLMQHKYSELLEQVRSGTRLVATEARIHMIRGKGHIALGGLDAAEREYEAARALDAADANALLGLAEVSLYRRNAARAEPLIAEALALAPDNAAGWSLHGDLRRSQGEVEGAVESYARAIALQPALIEPRRSRAALLINLNRGGEAQPDLDYLLELLPDDPQSIYLNALILGRAGKLEAATAELRRADTLIRSYDLAFTERHLPTLLIAGVINFTLGESDVALSYLGQYVQRDPQHIGARRMMASLYAQQRAHNRAVRVLRPVVSPNTQDARLLAQFATALMNSGQHAEASQVFQRAIALAPDLPQLRTRRALNDIAIGNSAEAIAGLQEALDRQAGTLEHAVLLGLTFLRQGDYDQALAVADELRAQHPDNPFGLNLAGAALWGKGDEAGARSSFLAAVALDPDYAPAHVNLAKLDIRGGDLEAAEARMLALVERALGGDEPLLALASIAERRGDFDAAIAWLERTQQALSDGYGSQIQLIGLHIRAENHQEALRLARQLEAAFPEELAVVEAVGRAANAAGDSDMAIRKYRRMAELAWKSPTDLNSIAALQQGAGDSTGAYSTLWRAASIEPTFLPAQASIIRYDASQGQTEKALARAETVRELYPDLPVGDMLAGDVLMQAKRPAEAAAAYEQGLAKQDDRALVLRLYLARREAGSEHALVALLQDWLTRHPDDAMVKRTLASEHARRGELDDAVRLNEELLQSLPDDAMVLNNLAWLYQETGRPEARQYAERAYALAPTEPRTLDTLGWILVQQGEPREGLGLLRNAQARAAGDAAIDFHVAVALKALGRREDAKAQLEAVLSRHPDAAFAKEASALLEELVRD